MNKNELILNHISLAEKIAKIQFKKTPCVYYEDLQSASYMGLVQAATRYIPELNDNFEAYVAPRIKGAILDYLRELSWGSRLNPFKPVAIDQVWSEVA